MVLFTDIEPDPPRRRAGWIGWAILGSALVGLVVVALMPAPYVFEVPGPVYDTLDEVTVGDRQVELIEIVGETTYPTDGSLDLLTVSFLYSRERPPSWLEVVQAQLDPSKTVVPVDLVYPAGFSVEDANLQNQIDMQNSQQEAIAAALNELRYEFDSRLKVATAQPDGPSDGVLQAGDLILSLNGVEYEDVTALREGIRENGTDRPASVVVLRDGEELEVQITPEVGEDGAPIVGIIVGGEYDFPIQITIQLENVGGASAGMMFALGIIDKLTEGLLNGGDEVAGTGTIAADGTVGPIGGIRQKLHGARDAGATWFLAPAANCDEVVGAVPNGLTVFAVETLDDALDVLGVIAADGDTSALRSCEAVG